MIIRCTDLDQLIWFRRMEDMTTAELIQRLKHESPPNEKMLAGTAFHAILENPPGDTLDEVEMNGIKFRFDCDATIHLPQVREIRANKNYQVDGRTITLSGGTDGIDGNTVYDHKLTFRPAPENYFDSFQWRAYLSIYGADKFVYYLYHGKEDDGVIRIVDVSELPMYRYPGMEEDLIGGIRDLVQFMESNAPEMIS